MTRNYLFQPIIDKAGAGASIGGLVTSGTQGSILFLGASGVLAQNNTNLFWDDANDKFNIGNPSTTDARFNIQALSGGNLFRIVSNTGTGSVLIYKSSGNNSLFIRQGSTDTFCLGSTDGQIGILTTAPTHTLSLASASTGISKYNTADQTTNYERILDRWASNEYWRLMEVGGTGTRRTMGWGFSTGSTSGGAVKLSSSVPHAKVSGAAISTAGNLVEIGAVGNMFAGTGIQTIANIIAGINQSGTAGYTALGITSTEAGTGSGAKNLILATVGGVEKFKVDNAGLITTASATLIASSVALTNGAGVGAGTLANAPTAGNPTKWIPINDNGTTRYIPAW